MRNEIIVNDYVICGPFPYSTLIPDGVESFNIDFLKDLGGEQNAELREGTYIGSAKCIPVHAENGVIDLAKLYGEEFADFWKLRHGVSYAYTTIELNNDAKMVFLMGAEDFVKVYFNGKNVFTSHVAKKFRHGFHAFPVQAKRGLNRVLIKIGRFAGRWMFSFSYSIVEAPFFINKYRVMLPQLVKDEIVDEWISVQLLALNNIKSISIRCEENDFWYPCSVKLNSIKYGEIVNIPIHIRSKHSLSDKNEASLALEVEGDNYLENINLDFDVVDKASHRIASFRSSADGSVQLYGYKLPKNMSKEKKYGLILVLHGFKGHPSPSALFGEKDWVIVASPSARGEVPYREIGLIDVIEVLEVIKSRFNIDENRVYLLGHSMGGYGVWYIGTKYPHLFAALAPLSSRSSFDELIAKLSSWRGWEGITKLYKLYDPLPFFINLLNTPVFISHGSADRIVPVEESRRAANELRRLGYDYYYEEVPEAPHVWGEYKPGRRYGLDALDRESIESFLRAKTRTVPKCIKLKVADPRFTMYWWIKLEKFNNIGLLHICINNSNIVIKDIKNIYKFRINIKELIEAKLLTTENVNIVFGNAKLSLYIGKSLKPIIVTIKNKNEIIASSEFSVSCYHGDKILSDCNVVDIDSPSGEYPPEKHEKVTGPFMNLFNSKFIIVPCNNPKKECHEAATYIQHWWVDYANGYTRILDCNEVLQRKLYNKYNILLIGGPKLNKLTRLMLNYIDIVQIQDNGVKVRNKSFKGAKLGVAFVYPSPLNPQKLIGIIGGNSIDSIKAIKRINPTIIPDIVVYDAQKIGIDKSGIIYSDFFDEKWN